MTEPSQTELHQLSSTARRMAHRLLSIAANRIEIFLLEMHAERDQIARIVVIALAAMFMLLAGILLLSATIVVWLWAYSPLVVLMVLTCTFFAASAALILVLRRSLSGSRRFPETISQLRKDHALMEETLL